MYRKEGGSFDKFLPLYLSLRSDPLFCSNSIIYMLEHYIYGGKKKLLIIMIQKINGLLKHLLQIILITLTIKIGSAMMKMTLLI